MNLTATKEQLLPIVARAVSIADGKSLPILGHVLIDVNAGSVRATGCDLQTQIVATGSVDSKSSHMTIAAPAKKLADIVKMLPDGAAIKMKADGERMTIQSGRSRYALACRSAEDFPGFEGRGEILVEQSIPAGAMLELLNRVRASAGQADVRQYLNGVAIQFDGSVIRAVASNGHRLSLMETESDAKAQSRTAIVPNRGVIEICKILAARDSDDPVSVSLKESVIRADVGDIMLSSKLIEGVYPDYRRVMPSETVASLVVNARDLSDALRRVQIINDDRTGVAMSASTDEILLKAANAQAEESIESVPLIESDAEHITHGYSAAYLIDALATCKTETARIELASNGAALISETGESPWRALVMPMRL